MNTDNSKISVWLPRIPQTLSQELSAAASAQGTIYQAMEGHHASYNGHHVFLHQCVHGYWIAEYSWAGRNVIRRGTVEQCLESAANYYKRGIPGSSVSASIPAEAEQFAIDLGFVPWSPEIEKEHYENSVTPLHKEIGTALWLEKHFGCPATTYLLESENIDEYKNKIETWQNKNRGNIIVRDDYIPEDL